ncbi:EF-hand domain-containing protein [Sphingomonas sp. RS6]
MRIQVIAGLVLIAASGAQAQDRPSPGMGPGGGPGGGPGMGHGMGGPLFISPMGQPFRGPGAADAWFDGADANHDGVLTLDEFQEDAMRWFKVLDRGHDGEIDPDDIEVYETKLVPEIRGGGFGDMGGPPMGEDGEKKAVDLGATRFMSGAAPFNYLGMPEPVTSADRSLNGGVSPTEFMEAASRRFKLLDTNQDGKLTKKELPEIRHDAGKRRGRRGRGGGMPGGGMPGGMQGGGMGGMSGMGG